MKVRLGEKPWYSFQGEGVNSGGRSVWFRLFGCNLTCPSFGLEPGENKYGEFLAKIDPKSLKSVNDAPTLPFGCDSIYSHLPEFKHLAIDYTEETLAVELNDLVQAHGGWVHNQSRQPTTVCITGGEPMMWQKQIQAVLQHIIKSTGSAFNFMRPLHVEIETNGTKPISDEFAEFIKDNDSIMLTFNISPKMWNVAGEPDERAWKPEVVASYVNHELVAANLKIVANETDACWEEIGRKMKELMPMLVYVPKIMIMPVGSTKALQEQDVIPRIIERALKEGYNITGRLHLHLMGDGPGI